LIFAFWGSHYGVDAPFTPDEILDLITVWILFISFRILWYKIDLQKNLTRRLLYYINFFIVFASLLLLTFWIQEFWLPIPLIIIIIYAILALIIKFTHKRPHNTKILGLWTIFLLLTFIMMILQVEVFQPNDQWIAFILIGTFLIFAIMSTILDSISKK